MIDVSGCIYGPLILRAKRYAMRVSDPDLALLIEAMLLKSVYQQNNVLHRLDGTYKYLIISAPKELKRKAGDIIRRQLKLDRERRERAANPLFQKLNKYKGFIR